MEEFPNRNRMNADPFEFFIHFLESSEGFLPTVSHSDLSGSMPYSGEEVVDDVNYLLEEGYLEADSMFFGIAVLEGEGFGELGYSSGETVYGLTSKGVEFVEGADLEGLEGTHLFEGFRDGYRSPTY